jgi:hypothetical protein
MAEVIAWLGIPVLATLAAIVWVLWAARPKPRQDVIDSVASYERFKAALGGQPHASAQAHAGAGADAGAAAPSGSASGHVPDERG